MSKIKIIVGIVGLILILGVAWIYIPKDGMTKSDMAQVATTTDAGSLASSTDTSDAAINADMEKLDAQLKDLDSASTAVDASLQ